MAVLALTIAPDEFLGLSALVELGRSADADLPSATADAIADADGAGHATVGVAAGSEEQEREQYEKACRGAESPRLSGTNNSQTSLLQVLRPPPTRGLTHIA